MLKVVHIAVEVPPEKLKKPRKLTRRQLIVKTAMELLPILQFNDRQRAMSSFPEEEAEIALLEQQLVTKTLK